MTIINETIARAMDILNISKESLIGVKNIDGSESKKLSPTDLRVVKRLSDTFNNELNREFNLLNRSYDEMIKLTGDIKVYIVSDPHGHHVLITIPDDMGEDLLNGSSLVRLAIIYKLVNELEKSNNSLLGYWISELAKLSLKI